MKRLAVDTVRSKAWNEKRRGWKGDVRLSLCSKMIWSGESQTRVISPWAASPLSGNTRCATDIFNHWGNKSAHITWTQLRKILKDGWGGQSRRYKQRYPEQRAYPTVRRVFWVSILCATNLARFSSSSTPQKGDTYDCRTHLIQASRSQTVSMKTKSRRDQKQQHHSSNLEALSNKLLTWTYANGWQQTCDHREIIE